MPEIFVAFTGIAVLIAIFGGLALANLIHALRQANASQVNPS